MAVFLLVGGLVTVSAKPSHAAIGFHYLFLYLFTAVRLTFIRVVKKVNVLNCGLT